ncbi:MAG: sialate O-acetylesterase [Polyangiales bacterium]
MRRLAFLAAVCALAVACSTSDAPAEPTPDAAADDIGVDTAVRTDATDSAVNDVRSDVLAEAGVDAAVPFDFFAINHVLCTGQSLSVGAVGAPPLSTKQPYANLMFEQGVIPGGVGLTKLVPLIETTDETMSSGMANDVTKVAREVLFKGLAPPRDDHVLLVSCHGVGGQPYSELKKGTDPFKNGIAQVVAAKAIAAAAKSTYVVRVVTNVHGESDHVAKNASYDKDLLQWQADYETDVKAITGQTTAIPMLHTQMSSFTKYGQATSPIPQLQLDASRASAGKLVLVGPKYTSIYSSDGVHLTNAGYRLMGESYAKVYRKVVLEKKTWLPLGPKTIKREGVTITVDFDVPSPPLVLDTTLVTDPGSYGFEVVDDLKTVKIASVALAGATSVKLVLATAPTGKVRVRYAFTGVAGALGGAKTGARGNLRDSDDTPSAYGPAKLFNWCVHFDQALP